MGALDFLFEGSPPPSVTTYGQTVEGMPKWMSDYTQGLIAKANAIGGESYQAYGGPRIAEFTPDQMKAFEMTRAGAGKAPGMIEQAAGMPGALATANPYFAQAGQKFPQAVNEYMNPYTENVVNRAGILANRTLNEQFMPALEARFGSAGHDSRSSAYRRAADQGVRDITEGLHSQSLGALSQAYDTAAQTFGADATRLGALGQSAGALAGQDRGQTADLAGALQKANITDAAALETVGRTEQGLNQSSLDLAYNDFANQRDYPRSTIDWMSSVIRGLPSDRAVTSTSTGPSSVSGPSPLAQLGSLASTGMGIYETIKDKARGGRVRRAHGGALRYGHA